jgi:membrane fusion protein (multidrug efflux system)
VDGDENITYSAKVPSVVTKINVTAGQHVSKGTILAELDAKCNESTIGDAPKNNMNWLNTMYDKRKELWDQNSW